MGIIESIREFGRDGRTAVRNLARGNPSPLERSISVPAISAGALETDSFPDLTKQPGTAGKLVYDALFLTNNSSVDIEVVYSTGAHLVFAGQPFDLQFPAGTTHFAIKNTDGATGVNTGEIEVILKMRGAELGIR